MRKFPLFTNLPAHYNSLNDFLESLKRDNLLLKEIGQMSKSILRKLLSKAIRLSAITKELGHCGCANLIRQTEPGGLFNNPEMVLQTARKDCDKVLHSGCVGGVCEVTWKPASHAA